MARIVFTTDFHIGFRPKSHVTQKSALAYQGAVLSTALACNEEPADHRINLGDLFDKYSNPESVILDAREVVKDYDWVLSGNHDVRNIEGSVSSLDVLEHSGVNVAFTHQEANWETRWVGGVTFHALCHYYSQGEFEAAVRSVCQHVKAGSDVLLLHCNVGDGHGNEVEADQSSLYLTSELQDLVSKTFRWVLVGHEHVRRVVKPNLIILGNHFPLSFGEIGEKYIHVLDTETMELEAKTIYNEPKVMIDAQDLIRCEGVVNLSNETDFVEITGTIQPDERPELSRALICLWRNNTDQLLAVRNNVEVLGAPAAKRRSASAGQDFVSYLRQQVEEAGFGEELEELE